MGDSTATLRHTPQALTRLLSITADLSRAVLASPRDVADNLVLAVDEALLVPGEIVRTAVCDRIERSYQPRREEIPEKLETFHQALQDLLGKSAKVMEKLIAKSLYRLLELNFTEHDGWTLVDYVNNAKRSKANGSREG